MVMVVARLEKMSTKAKTDAEVSEPESVPTQFLYVSTTSPLVALYEILVPGKQVEVLLREQ